MDKPDRSTQYLPTSKAVVSPLSALRKNQVTRNLRWRGKAMCSIVAGVVGLIAIARLVSEPIHQNIIAGDSRALKIMNSQAVPPYALFGICYSPFHHRNYGNRNEMAAILRDDMRQIRTYFSHMRTYYSNFMDVNVVNIAAEMDLKVALGIKMTVEGLPYAFIELEIESAIFGAAHYTNTVEAIYVGNENLKSPDGSWGSVSAWEIVSIIDRVRAALKDTKARTVPIGTVQRINEWLVRNHEVDQLADRCDVIGVNIYPFFTPNDARKAKVTAADQIIKLRQQWQMMYERFPQHAHKIRLTETGHPSAGSSWFSTNIPSSEANRDYFLAFLDWSQYQHHPSYYFMMYNLRYPIYPDVEEFFGIADADGRMKFAFTPPDTPLSPRPKPPSPPLPSFTLTSNKPDNGATNSRTTWFCRSASALDDPSSPLLRSACQVERLCDESKIPLVQHLYCCHEGIGKSCLQHQALAWSSCDVSLLESICIRDRNTHIVGRWVCRLHALGDFTESNCEFIDLGHFHANMDRIACCVGGEKGGLDDPCLHRYHQSWDQCSWVVLERLIQFSQRRERYSTSDPNNDNNDGDKWPEAERESDEYVGNWFCRDPTSKGLLPNKEYRRDNCDIIRNCAEAFFIQTKCCTKRSEQECPDSEMLPTPSCSLSENPKNKLCGLSNGSSSFTRPTVWPMNAICLLSLLLLA